MNKPKGPPRMNEVHCYYLPRKLLDAAEEVAEMTGTSRAAAIRHALAVGEGAVMKGNEIHDVTGDMTQCTLLMRAKDLNTVEDIAEKFGQTSVTALRATVWVGLEKLLHRGLDI